MPERATKTAQAAAALRLPAAVRLASRWPVAKKLRTGSIHVATVAYYSRIQVQYICGT